MWNGRCVKFISRLDRNGQDNVERLYNGVYYLSYRTILGTKGRVSMDRYIEKRLP